MYYQVELKTNNLIGSPIDLPTFLVGLQPISLQDLSWTDPTMELSTVGLWPIVDAPLPIDNTTQVLDGVIHYVANPTSFTVSTFQGVREMTTEESTAYEAAITAQIANTLTSAISTKVNAVSTEFDTIVNNGATYENKVFQIDSGSRANIDAGSLLATIAMSAGGGKAGDLRWANPNVDFGWIATDNSILPMDAPSLVKFGQTMAGYYTELIFTKHSLVQVLTSLTDLNAVSSFDITQGWPSSTVG